MPHNHQFIWKEIGFYETVFFPFLEITFAVPSTTSHHMRYISCTKKKIIRKRTAENGILPLELDGSVMMVAVLQFPEHK